MLDLHLTQCNPNVRKGSIPTEAQELLINKSNNAISKCKDKKGKLVHKSSEIANVFKDCFCSRYIAENSGEEDGMNIFFQKTKIPKVGDFERNLLDVEITSEEVERAIANLKHGKACSPDGFLS